jgi:hypothetical protein
MNTGTVVEADFFSYMERRALAFQITPHRFKCFDATHAWVFCAHGIFGLGTLRQMRPQLKVRFSQ